MLKILDVYKNVYYWNKVALAHDQNSLIQNYSFIHHVALAKKTEKEPLRTSSQVATSLVHTVEVSHSSH